MSKIIKLNRNYVKELADIDYESEHQGDKKYNITKSEMQKDIVKRFKINHELWFGYKDKNELIGYVTIKPFFPGYKHCEVYWLTVKKKYQGKGIGKQLIKFIEQYAKKQGFRKVCLYTKKDMLKTRRFYENIGYKLINEFSGYYGYTTGNTTAVLYAKDL